MKALLVVGPVSFAMFAYMAAAVGFTILFAPFISDWKISDESTYIILSCTIVAGAGFGLYAAKKAPWPSIRYATTRISIALALSLAAVFHLFMNDAGSNLFGVMGLLEASIVTFFIGAVGCALFLFNKTRLQYMVFWPPVFVVIALIYWWVYFLPYLPY